jgi:hypothetical protein
VAKRVHLDHQGQRDAIPFPQLDQPIEDRFPLLVPREIVIGDKELVDTLRPVDAH